MNRYLYLIQKLKDGHDYKKGMTIWAKGWRIIKKVRAE